MMFLSLPFLALAVYGEGKVCLSDELSSNSCECKLYACEANVKMMHSTGGSAECVEPMVVLIKRMGQHRGLTSIGVFSEVVDVLNTFPETDIGAEEASFLYTNSNFGVKIPVYDDAGLSAALLLAEKAGDEFVELTMVGDEVECNAPSYEMNPDENERSYSGVWDDNGTGTGHARSMLDSAQAWSAKTNKAGEYIQIDVGVGHEIVGVVTQARIGNTQMVTSYTVSYSDNKWAGTFTDVDFTFEGNLADEKADNRKINLFEDLDVDPFKARYVRIIVKTWTGHASMRVGLMIRDCVAHSTCSGDSKLLNPAENERDYSATWAADPNGSGHGRSMLDSPQAWSAQKNQAGEWMQIDLGKNMVITGVVTQGRADTTQWVTSYKLAFAVERWATFATFDNGRVLTGNKDKSSKVVHTFEEDARFTARFVRFVVQTWSGHASMRAAVYALDC